jgi:hypothetical protein
MWGGRACDGVRALARVLGVEGSEDSRWARRYGCGESLAKVARGKVRVGWEAAGVVIVAFWRAVAGGWSGMPLIQMG